MIILCACRSSAAPAISVSRVEVQQIYEGMAGKLNRDASDTWETVRQKLEAVQISEMFGDLSDDNLQALLQQIQAKGED